MKRTQRLLWTVMGCAAFAAVTASAKTETQEKTTDTGKTILLPSCTADTGSNPEKTSGTLVGSVSEITATSAEMEFYDLKPLMERNRLDPEDMTGSTGTVKRKPADGKIYLILTASVAPRRSVGKHDYRLRIGKDEISCLAISGSEDAKDVLDQRMWEFRNKNDKFPMNVRLIYEIPDNAVKATLFPVRPQMFPGGADGSEITVPADSNTKAPPKKAKPAAEAEAATAAPAAAPAAAPVAAKEQTAEEAFADALKILEDGQNEKFAAKYIPKDKLNSLPTEAEERRKDIETLALAVRGKLQALKDKKPEMQEEGKAALFSDGDKNKVTFVKSGSSWILRLKK